MVFNIEQLENKLKTEGLNDIYLFYGEEVYFIDVIVRKIKKAFGEIMKGINYILIDENNINELISNIETPVFGYERKLIIVKNAGIFKKETKKKSKTSLNIRRRLEQIF